MKAFLLLLLAAILIAGSGCECDKYKCPAFSDQHDQAWLPQNNKIIYRSGSSVITFSTGTKDLSRAYGEDESVLSFSCKQNDCLASAKVQAGSDAVWGGANLSMAIDITNTFLKKDLMASRLEYTIGDMQAGISIYPQLQASDNAGSYTLYADSVLDINTGTRIYPAVLMQTRKPVGGAKILKTYWYEGAGLIGFADSSGTCYWLQ